jgi:mono/diheme cytochrome c family protein
MMKTSTAMQMSKALFMLFIFLFAVIPLANATDLERGAEVYKANCVACHGPNG